MARATQPWDHLSSAQVQGSLKTIGLNRLSQKERGVYFMLLFFFFIFRESKQMILKYYNKFAWRNQGLSPCLHLLFLPPGLWDCRVSADCHILHIYSTWCVRSGLGLTPLNLSITWIVIIFRAPSSWGLWQIGQLGLLHSEHSHVKASPPVKTNLLFPIKVSTAKYGI